jgi:carboxylesterase type B
MNPIAAIKGYSEDCLFLDVYVPKDVNPRDNIPVLAWIYGGGYAAGSKEDAYMYPTGLFRMAEKPMIFVALNYRLGVFGWAAPPSEPTVVPNAGLHDARAALQWIQKYIHKFGGDVNDVTVFGQSAGAGVIMHSITAYGGTRDPPLFQKVILQSAGFLPTRGNHQARDAVFKAFMAQVNCIDIACLRLRPTQTLMLANGDITQHVPAGGIGFSVVVDGDFVPDLPGRLFLQGKYHKTLTSVIVANTECEGLAYIPYHPQSMTIDHFNGYLTSLVPNISSASQDAVRALYLDPASEGSIHDRTVALISDIIFTCNAQVIASSYAAHNNNAYRYIFAMPPAGHGQDVPYTFYSSGDSPTDYSVTNTTVAFAIQRIVTSLSQFGIPQAESTPLEKYGAAENVLILNVTGIEQHAGDPWHNKRCAFWQKADYVQG